MYTKFHHIFIAHKNITNLNYFFLKKIVIIIEKVNKQVTKLLREKV